MTLADVVSRAALLAWLFCLACLSPAIVRLFRARPRYLDFLWGIAFLGTSNRIFYLERIDLDLARVWAVLLAIGFGCTALWYQRHDA